jgi:hypothetical protein
VYETGFERMLNIKNNWMKNIIWRVALFAYFLELQRKSKSFGRDANRKTAWMQVSARAL